MVDPQAVENLRFTLDFFFLTWVTVDDFPITAVPQNIQRSILPDELCCTQSLWRGCHRHNGTVLLRNRKGSSTSSTWSILANASSFGVLLLDPDNAGWMFLASFSNDVLRDQSPSRGPARGKQIFEVFIRLVSLKTQSSAALRSSPFP
jgi:hypothetical protein